MRYHWAAMALLVVVGPTVAGETAPVWERWESAYLGGVRSGHVRTFATEVISEGERHFATTVEMRLQIKRFSDLVHLGMDTGTIETPAGYVTGVFMRQYLGKTQKLEIRGQVDGDKLNLTLNKDQPLKPAPWNDKVLGIYGQHRLFQERKVQPGDHFGYYGFEPAINLIVTTRVEIKDYEEVELFNSGQRKRLLRAEIRGDKVQTYQPPLLVSWLDENREVVRSETEIPGLGKIVLYRTTREQALAPIGGGGKAAEVNQYVALRQRLLRPHETTQARYRIKIQGEQDIAGSFAEDLRQHVLSTSGNTFEIEVRKGPSAAAEQPGPESLANSYFIASADAKVKEHARNAVGGEIDPMQKALRIERWVNQRMTPKPYEALATADHVARHLEGDCTEYAMLMAAMCRAEGVPARTAIGLVYGENSGAPVFAFHMWTEVWVRGQWYPFDATLGRGSIGAAHLKITDQSWQDERSMAPLLPVLRVLGRLQIEILGAQIAKGS